MSYTIEVFGRPAPKGSMIQGRTKTGKSYTRPASKYQRPWTNAVRDATKNVMRHHIMLDPPYVIDLTFRLQRPATHPEVWPTASDLDKLTRCCLDGLVAGGAIKDDRHVVELCARKAFLEKGEDSTLQGVVAWVDRVVVEAAAEQAV